MSPVNRSSDSLELSCVVIGAGPGGIVATKELLEQGVTDVVCLEKSDRLGGVFSGSYDSLTLTSSCAYSMFSDHWIGDGNEHHFWTKAEVVDYWTAYARKFGVVEHIRFGVDVESAEQSSTGWTLRLADGSELRTRRLVLATGGNRFVNLPDWHTQLTGVKWLHSKDYVNARELEGKRVLIVGGGESSADITLEISRAAAQTWVSLRRTAGWVVPRHRSGRAADLSTNRALWGLPRSYGPELSQRIISFDDSHDSRVNKVAAELNRSCSDLFGVWSTFGTKNHSLPEAIANHGCQVVGDIVEVADGGRRLRESGGAWIDGVDVVLFCTGYKARAPFLPPALRDTDPRSLYKHMLHPGHGSSLAWIGLARPGFGSQFPIMEMQARYFALLASGAKSLPDKETMTDMVECDASRFLSQFGHNARRIRNLVDYHRFMDSMAALIGCEPPLVSSFFLRPRLWLRMVYGPTQATQFRLRGPGKKPRLAREIIMKIPISRFNHMMKASVKWRLREIFRSRRKKQAADLPAESAMAATR
jgi:dimethylaniline monooxygenase (N-oxide forming)